MSASTGDQIIVMVYIDDLLIMSRKKSEIDKLGAALRRAFELKDLGEVSRCLGMDFTRDREKIKISQATYISSILARFGMTRR